MAELPISEFYKHFRMADGYLSFCKSCVKDRVAEHRKQNIERIRAYDIERFKNDPKRRRLHAVNTGLYRLRHPEKRLAHHAVSNALRAGKLKRLPCEYCGNPKSEAHHEDYSKRLDVRWLCKTCHMSAHYHQDRISA